MHIKWTSFIPYIISVNRSHFKKLYKYKLCFRWANVSYLQEKKLLPSPFLKGEIEKANLGKQVEVIYLTLKFWNSKQPKGEIWLLFLNGSDLSHLEMTSAELALFFLKMEILPRLGKTISFSPPHTHSLWLSLLSLSSSFLFLLSLSLYKYIFKYIYTVIFLKVSYQFQTSMFSRLYLGGIFK